MPHEFNKCLFRSTTERLWLMSEGTGFDPRKSRLVRILVWLLFLVPPINHPSTGRCSDPRKAVVLPKFDSWSLQWLVFGVKKRVWFREIWRKSFFGYFFLVFFSNLILEIKRNNFVYLNSWINDIESPPGIEPLSFRSSVSRLATLLANSEYLDCAFDSY